jgi:thioredoxin 1
MEEVAEDYSDKIKLVKLDVQDNQEMASVYGVMSIPSVKMFKDGKIISEFLGARPASAVKEWIDESL